MRYETWMKRVGAEDRQHVHVLLRVVQLVEAPEEADPMVGQVGEPVAPVHGHQNQGDGAPAGHRPDPGQDDPGQVAAGDLREGEAQRGHQGHDQGGVEHGEEEILAVAPGDERPALGRAHPLDHHDDPDDGQGERPDEDDTEAGHGGAEVRPAPMVGPTERHQGRRDGDDGERRQIDTGAQGREGPADPADRGLRRVSRSWADIEDGQHDDEGRSRWRGLEGGSARTGGRRRARA